MTSDTESAPRRARLKRWLIRGAIGLAAATAGLLLLDRLCPPDLSRAERLSTLVVDRQGAPLRLFPAADGRWRWGASVDQVDPLLISLLLAWEDKRFYSHPGVDLAALLRAAGQALGAGRILSGGSTLTMQTARLLEPRPRGLSTKLRQMARALQLELRYSKQEILGLYLTLAPYGGPLEGARAASWAWFGKGPEHLTPWEAAALVALPQSPERRRPDRHPQRLAAAAARVLARGVEQGLIPADYAEPAADADPATLRPRRPMPQAALHASARLARTAPPGAVIKSTLDGKLQAQAEGLARRAMASAPDPAAAAMIVVELPGRRVRAWVGGQGWDQPGGFLDLARAVRSPGSALKPVIYAMAFDDGVLRPGSLMDDRPTWFGDWAPRNFDRGYMGAVSAADALRMSLNVPAVQALSLVGADRFVQRLARLGTPLRPPKPGAPLGLAAALGGAGASLADLATLAAALADDGRMQPLALTEAQIKPPLGELVSPLAAREVGQILAEAARPDAVAQTAHGTRRIAYKTGTSYGFRDAWAIGWTASHAAAVWVGRPDGTPRPGEIGRNAAAPLLFSLFDAIPGLEGLPAPDAAMAEPPRPFKFDESGFAIVFPPDGAELLAPLGRDGRPAPLALRARGGTPPIRWLVDGQPLPAPDGGAPGARADWTPPGPGFARIVALDAAGRSAVATIRLTEE